MGGARTRLQSTESLGQVCGNPWPRTDERAVGMPSLLLTVSTGPLGLPPHLSPCLEARLDATGQLGMVGAPRPPHASCDPALSPTTLPHAPRPVPQLSLPNLCSRTPPPIPRSCQPAPKKTGRGAGGGAARKCRKRPRARRLSWATAGDPWPHAPHRPVGDAGRDQRTGPAHLARSPGHLPTRQ